jgi:DNA-binding NtrC family response regulator
MPWVSIIAGSGAGQRYELRAARTTIGRDAANHIQIADPKSSRVHAEIVVDTGRYQVRDLDSSNGTWSDEGRIASRSLSDGSEFRIGETRFRFESLASAQDDWADPAHLQGLDQAKTVLFTAPPAGDAGSLARTNAYLVLLHHLIRRSNAVADRDGLFELLDDAAAEALEGDRCAVFLPDETGAHGWRLWPAHERRLRARFGTVPFARTLLAAVRRDGEPLLCTSDGDLRPSQSMVQAGVQSAMAAPVRVGATVQALLYVDRLAAGQPFDRGDLEFLAAVATQMAARLAGRAPIVVQPLPAPAAPEESPPVPTVIGEDPAITALVALTSRLAVSEVPVLITGEPGTGKELLARRIHAQSSRGRMPFHVVACRSSPTQLATMLFGRPQSPGVFELAEGGTVVLDDVGALSGPLVGALLRVLERGELQRPDSAIIHQVDVRIMATARDAAAVPGALRSVLGDALVMPPLRARAGDIAVLSEAFLRQGPTPRHPTPEARALLLRYPWPGNVRELRQALDQAAARATGHLVTPADLPEAVRRGMAEPGETPIPTLAAVEKAHILRVLDHCGGNKKAAAELLEIDRSTLYAKLRQYGLA